MFSLPGSTFLSSAGLTRDNCGESYKESIDESKYASGSQQPPLAPSHGSKVSEDVGTIEEVTEVAAAVHVSA